MIVASPWFTLLLFHGQDLLGWSVITSLPTFWLLYSSITLSFPHSSSQIPTITCSPFCISRHCMILLLSSVPNISYPFPSQSYSYSVLLFSCPPLSYSPVVLYRCPIPPLSSHSWLSRSAKALPSAPPTDTHWHSRACLQATSHPPYFFSHLHLPDPIISSHSWERKSEDSSCYIYSYRANQMNKLVKLRNAMAWWGLSNRTYSLDLMAVV